LSVVFVSEHYREAGETHPISTLGDQFALGRDANPSSFFSLSGQDVALSEEEVP
jgi:hypothetical protein